VASKSYESDLSKMLKRSIVWLLIIVILITGCLGCNNNLEPSISPSAQPSPTMSYIEGQSLVGSTFGNLANLGYSVEYKGYIYFRTSIGRTDALYRMSISDKKFKLVAERTCVYLNIYQDSVFFIEESSSSWDNNSYVDNNYSLFRMSTTGENIYKYPVKCIEINVTSDYIFYIEKVSKDLYRMNHDGSNIVQLTKDETCLNLMVYKDWVYYFNKDQTLTRIHAMNPLEKLEIANKCRQAIIDNGQLYFVKFSDTKTENGLFKADLDGNNKKQLYSKDVVTFNIANDFVYFTTALDGDLSIDIGLNRMKTDGTAIKRIEKKNYYRHIYVYSDFIFFIQPGEEGGYMFEMDIDGSHLRDISYLHEISSKPTSEDVTETGTLNIDLKQIEKACALCLSYANEMYSGGHSGWFDVYPEVDANELIEALRLIGADAFADNFIEAKNNGENDGYIETDTEFYKLKPPLESVHRKLCKPPLSDKIKDNGGFALWQRTGKRASCAS
jgi:hypothetical protein